MCRLIILALLSSTALAQPSFEVAEVKPNRSGEIRMAIDMQPGGRFSARNVPLKVLIALAYHLRPERLVGAPSWAESERFDIVAKAAETASPEDVRRMVQVLLAERFKLATHTEERLLAGYALVPGKSGPKLQPSDSALLSAQRCVPGEGQPGQRHIECHHMTMAVLADYLQELAPRDFLAPVVDQTGLKGGYDFNLDWAPAPTETGPTIFDAVEAQLGLKLESRKLPLPVVVIDQVNRVPVEN